MRKTSIIGTILAGSLVVLGQTTGAAASGLFPGISIDANPHISAMVETFNDPSFLGFEVRTPLSDGTSTAPALATGLDILIFGTIDTTLGTPSLIVTDSSSNFFLVADTLLDTAFALDQMGTDDIIELLYGDISADPNGAFGHQVVVKMVGEFGTEPFGQGYGDFLSPVMASLVINPVISAVPMPATAGLLLLGVLGVCAVRRARA